MIPEDPVEVEPKPEPVELTLDLTWDPFISWLFIFIINLLFVAISAQRDGEFNTPQHKTGLVLMVICLGLGVGYALAGIRRGGWINRIISILALLLLVPFAVCLAYAGIVDIWLYPQP